MLRLLATRFLKALVTTMVIVLAIVAGSVLVMGIRGTRFLRVATDSMEPGIRKGDLVVALPSTVWPKVGDVVSFTSNISPGEIITHRVQTVDTVKDLIVTKGDNAVLADSPIRKHQIVGIIAWHSAVAGKIVHLLRRPFGLVIGIYLPGLAIIGYELRMIQKNTNQHRRYIAA